MTAFEIAIGIFFVFAVAGYWIFERETAMKVVAELLPRPKRKVVRDTWLLIDLKLGAYVRGIALIVAHRRDGALAALLGDRLAVLAADRLLRGIRRDRAGDRPARGCGARGRRRTDRVGAPRRARAHRRRRGPALAGLPREPARDGLRRRHVAARRALLGVRGRLPLRRLLASARGAVGGRRWSRSSTSSCATRPGGRRDPTSSSRARPRRRAARLCREASRDSTKRTAPEAA